VWPTLNTSVELYHSYAATFGYARSIPLFAARRRAFKSGQRTQARIPGTDILLTLRLGTTDINVFEEIFANLEYQWNFNAPPTVIVDVGGYTGLSAAFFAHTYP
jgi:hypothetical protein